MSKLAALLKDPVGVLMRRLRRAAPTTPSAAPPSVLDHYATAAPEAQATLDIFKGEWSSLMPGEWAKYRAGGVPLFEDPRIAWWLAELGGVAGQNVLELGPLEGGHSSMLEAAGAASVTAVEANARAYLKCLVIKELFGLKRCHFLYGDFVAFLKADPPRYDFVLASGVLYHMRRPAELFSLLAKVTDRVLLWTHYYDEAVIGKSDLLRPKFPPGVIEEEYEGFRHRLHRQEYSESLKTVMFCGGGAEHSYWMPRADVLEGLRHFGFTELRVTMEQPDFANGPCFLVAARKP